MEITSLPVIPVSFLQLASDPDPDLLLSERWRTTDILIIISTTFLHSNCCCSSASWHCSTSAFLAKLSGESHVSVRLNGGVHFEVRMLYSWKIGQYILEINTEVSLFWGIRARWGRMTLAMVITKVQIYTNTLITGNHWPGNNSTINTSTYIHTHMHVCIHICTYIQNVCLSD